MDQSLTIPARGMPAAPTMNADEASAGAGIPSMEGKNTRQPRHIEVARLVPVVAALASGIVIDRWAEPWGTRTWVEVAIVSVTIAALLISRKWLFLLALWVGVAAVGGGWHHYRWSDMTADDLAWTLSETPSPVWLRGTVRETLGQRVSEGFGASPGDRAQITTRFVLDMAEISDGKSWRGISGRAVTIVAGDRRDVEIGQAVEAAGQIARPAGPMNPGEFDYRAYLQAQGIRLRLTIDDSASLWRQPGARESWLAGLVGRIRSWSRRRLMERLDPSIAPLAAALLLGQREGIDPEVNDAFARTGTTHLLAVSGLQLQALAMTLLLAFRAFGIGRRPCYWVVGLAMAGYAVVVGPAPSVVRATIMTLSFCLAAIVGRLDRPANTMALAALGTLALNPSNLFDIGCQLSFLAIGTLIWLVPPACNAVRSQLEKLRCLYFGPVTPLDEYERRIDPVWRQAIRLAAAWLRDGVIGSAVVWLAALPLVALTFHLISPIGILLNIPLIPLTTVALLLGGLSLVLSAVWLPLGAPLAWAASVLLKLTKAIVLWGVAQPWGHEFVVGPGLGWVVVFYVLLGMSAVAATYSVEPVRPRWLTGSGPWWLLAGWGFAGWLLTADILSRPPALEANVLAVGHGLAILIQAPDGRNLLYDCGRLGDPSVGRRIIAPALWAKGVRRIDVVLLSHADEDHYNGLTDLLDRFPIGVVRAPPGFDDPANVGASRLFQTVRSRGIPVRPITARECWDEGGGRFTAIHPPAGWHPETPDNARSLVLDVAFAGHHLLLTGDLEQLGLIELLAQPSPAPPPDVLLSPHHGGRSANPEWLYEWAKPRVVVVSARRLAQGSSDTLSFVERMGIPLFRTGRQGSIRLDWTGDGIAARGFVRADRATNTVTDSAAEDERSWYSPRHWRGIGVFPFALWSNGIQLLAGIVGFVLGAFACLTLAVTEIGAWALVQPRRSIKQSLNAGSTAVECAQRSGESLVAIALDGARLAARWFPAADPHPTGRTVLLLHGFAEAASDLGAHRLAVLGQSGWNVASIDSRGYGESEGRFATFGGREAEDMRLWIDVFSKKMAQIDPTIHLEPAVWGRSMGAAIALRVAALDHRVVALVLESPMVDLERSTAAILRRRRIPFAKLFARLVIQRAGKLAGIPIDRPRPIESAAKARCRVMIVHGSDDTLVPFSEAARLAQAFGSLPRVLDVPGANHADVVAKGGDALLAQITRFLDEAVSAPSAGSINRDGHSDFRPN